jgi:hypothetical protein
MEARKLPQFKTEAEEARWWFEHREEVGMDLLLASRQGRAGEGSLARHTRKLAELQRAEAERLVKQ